MTSYEGYAVTDEAGRIIETQPRTAEGAIYAVNLAAQLSRREGPREVRRPDGRMIARYERGRRADLPPGGIIRLAQEKAARP